MSQPPLGERVTGRGYSREEYTPDELAESRHRNSILDAEFRDAVELVLNVAPLVLARHLGLLWIAAPSIFIRDNKPLIVGAVGLIGALNWQKLALLAETIAKVMQ